MKKIVILGMHRSGTSLASGLLSLSGVHFGTQDEFIQTNQENPKGFWERKDVRNLNDRLLHQMDCDWSEISNLYKKEIPERALKGFNSEADLIINRLQKESTTGVIGLKEPRLCLLMPFWQRVLDENDFFLLVYRDPEEIAISLKNRNGIPFEVSNYLTERYLGLACSAIKGKRHFIVSFKSLLEHPVQSIKSIVSAINEAGQKLTITNEERLSEHASPELYRSRPTGRSFNVSERLQYFFDCLNKGELPNVSSTEISASGPTLAYQHSKRFEEFTKTKNLLHQANIKLQNEKQKLIILQSKQADLESTVQKLNLAISNANEQNFKNQSLLADAKTARLESEHKLETTLQSALSLLHISERIIALLQSFNASFTWRIFKPLVSLMLSPARFRFGSTTLDEIDRHVELFNQWKTTERLSLESKLADLPLEAVVSEDSSEASPKLEENASSASKKQYCDEQVAQLLNTKGNTIRVGLVVTENSESTSAGDFHTAKELANALTQEFGWQCTYLPEHSESVDWHDVTNLDLLLVLLDKYDLSKLHGLNKPTIKIAWIRNWVDRWTIQPWFQTFDLVLCTSEIARDFIYEQTGKIAHILRIAANIKRFHPSIEINPELQSDYCFTGNYWGAPRQIENLDPSRLPYEFALFGVGWDKHKQFTSSYRGGLGYDKLPQAYRNTKILVDDANHVTKPWGSVNSRVFDALATGTLVITNGIAGAKETFDELLPTYSTNQELEQHLRFYLDHPDEREVLATKLQQDVIRNHSYVNRAREFREILKQELNTRARIAIKLPVNSASEAFYWRDFYFGKSLAKALRKIGFSVRLDFMSEWHLKPSIPDEVVIAIRGDTQYNPDSSHLNLLWITTHPGLVGTDECSQYDHIFVASKPYAKQLDITTDTRVTPLLQCTDSELFTPEGDQKRSRNVVFVGSSGEVDRPILNDAIKSGLKPIVIGKDLQGTIADPLIGGDYIEQKFLPKFYASSGVVLCNHSLEMREHGFMSNQLFDVVACGAIPVSHDIPGIKETFGDLVYVYSGGPDKLKQQVQKALSENETTRLQRLQLSRKIAGVHHFETRAKVLDSIISEHLKPHEL